MHSFVMTAYRSQDSSFVFNLNYSDLSLCKSLKRPSRCLIYFSTEITVCNDSNFVFNLTHRVNMCLLQFVSSFP